MTARDRAAASAGWGPLARWRGRRLFRAAARGDIAAREDVVRVADMPGHRLRQRARESLALWWASGGVPPGPPREHYELLREAVRRNGFVPAEPPLRHRVLALLGRLGECGPEEAPWVAGLLSDPDLIVRSQAAEFCRVVSEPVLSALWRQTEAPRPDSSFLLRQSLLENRRYPFDHVDRLWGEWLAPRPPEELGEALLRWGVRSSDWVNGPLSDIALERPPDVLNQPRHREALITALGYGDHPLYEIAERTFLSLADRKLTEKVCAAALKRPELVPFCRKHRLAPRDEVRRAMFFLLTGQPEQHRALDPDSSLLSLAYASASVEERARMLKAMRDAGGLDLVRVLVGDDRRGRIADMSSYQVEYLGGQLAGRREWDELWALVQDVPVSSGTALIRLFDGWLPRDADARRLFEMYLETPPEAVKAALDSAPEDQVPPGGQARLRFRGRVNDVSFAPDGPYLAAAGTKRIVGVFDLRRAELVERYDGFNTSVGRILHLGDGIVVAGERTNNPRRDCRLVLCADGVTRTLHTGPGSITSLARVDESGGFVAATRAGALVLGGRGGAPADPVPVRSLGRGMHWARTVAAHPASGRLAVLAPALVLAEVGDGSVVPLSAPTGPYANAAFVDTDLIACADRVSFVTMLRWSGEDLVQEADATVEWMSRFTASPALGGPVVATAHKRPYKATRRSLHFYDATLEETRVLSSLHDYDYDITSLTVSPGGELLAVGHADGHADVIDLRLLEVPEILRRPLVNLIPRDLGVVTGALTATSMSREMRASLQLIRASMEHRFRFEVEIDAEAGGAVGLTPGEYEISL